MYRLKATGTLIILLLFCLPANAGGPVEELKERQRGVRTVKAAFTQEKKSALLQKPIKSKGLFYFKQPVGVRWQYGEDLLLIYDGTDLYIYNRVAKEAEKIKGAQGFIGPLVFDIVLLIRDFEVDARTEGGVVTLDLKPRKKMPFKAMEMSFPKDAPFPSEVRVREETGDSTVIRFHDVRLNEPLKDALFTFSPPKGVELKERDAD